MDANHYVGYVKDEAGALHRDDSDSEIVREEQDGMHCKLGGFAALLHCNFLGGWLSVCASAITCESVQ